MTNWRKEFYITLASDQFKVGQIINSGRGTIVEVIEAPCKIKIHWFRRICNWIKRKKHLNSSNGAFTYKVKPV